MQSRYIVAIRVIKLIEANHHQARFVGGCVRDRLLGMSETISDYDIATSMNPDQVYQLFDNSKEFGVFDSGKQFGTVSVIYKNKDKDQKTIIEITTLRKDYLSDGRHCKVIYTDSFKLDSYRRDFTINAMYEDKDGKVFDYNQGQDDLKKKIICFVGDPEKRVQEDYLRILRLFRFAICYGFNYSDSSFLAAKKNVKWVAKLSKERIYSELDKLLASIGNKRYSYLQRQKHICQNLSINQYLVLQRDNLAKMFEVNLWGYCNNNLLQCINIESINKKTLISQGCEFYIFIGNVLRSQLEKVITIINSKYSVVEVLLHVMFIKNFFCLDQDQIANYFVQMRRSKMIRDMGLWCYLVIKDCDFNNTNKFDPIKTLNLDDSDNTDIGNDNDNESNKHHQIIASLKLFEKFYHPVKKNHNFILRLDKDHIYSLRINIKKIMYVLCEYKNLECYFAVLNDPDYIDHVSKHIGHYQLDLDKIKQIKNPIINNLSRSLLSLYFHLKVFFSYGENLQNKFLSSNEICQILKLHPGKQLGEFIQNLNHQIWLGKVTNKTGAIDYLNKLNKKYSKNDK